MVLTSWGSLRVQRDTAYKAHWLTLKFSLRIIRIFPAHLQCCLELTCFLTLGSPSWLVLAFLQTMNRKIRDF